MADRSTADAYTRLDRGPHDRYRRTRIYLDQTIKPGTQRLGIWAAPRFTLDGAEQRHTVTAADVGHIDLIAKTYYKDERLWWIVAWANRIKNPITDMYIGQQLVIPHLEKAAQQLAEVV